MKRAARGAELDEIEDVYRRRLGELRRVATAMTGSREAGIDAVQESFARAIQLRSSYAGRGSLDSWIWRIVVNTARDHISAAAGVVPMADASVHTNGSGGIDVAGGAGLHALVRSLPERQRVTLFLRYYADLDYATIAEALEISPGTVGATLTHARDSLQRLMSEAKR
jgi:RNA polymerase sigma-70 factor, ECF subfamily